MSNMANHAVKELLAVIHRDGGHHTSEVGTAQSIYDAAAICHEWKVMPERIAALEAEVAELRRDRERLDWLENEFQREHDWMMTAQFGNTPCPKSLFRKNEVITREAIDAAMTAEEEPCPQLSE